MAKQCDYQHGTCDGVATTTLMKNDGEVVQLCEFHRLVMIAAFRALASKEFEQDEEVVAAATHWLVLNKIPS
jgi:hypothetical protein